MVLFLIQGKVVCRFPGDNSMPGSLMTDVLSIRDIDGHVGASYCPRQ